MVMGALYLTQPENQAMLKQVQVSSDNPMIDYNQPMIDHPITTGQGIRVPTHTFPAEWVKILAMISLNP